MYVDIPISGGFAGALRLNYTETAANGYSTIKVESVQIATNVSGVNIALQGIVKIGDSQLFSINDPNARTPVYMYNSYSWETVQGGDRYTIQVPNDGSGRSVSLSFASQHSGWNDFNLWKQPYGPSDNAVLGSASITLSSYSTQTEAASTITSILSPVNLGETTTITIERQSNTSTPYTYVLEYSTNNSTWNSIGTITNSTSKRAYRDWTVSISGITTSTLVYVRCSTYVSATNSPVGTSSSSFTVNVPQVTVNIRINLNPVNTNSTISNWGNVYVQGFTKVGYSVNVTGSQIRSCTLTIGGIDVFRNTQGTTSFSGTTEFTISSSGSVPVQCVVVDKNGNNTQNSTSIDVIAYRTPYISSAVAYRYSTNINEKDAKGHNIAFKGTAFVEDIIINNEHKNTSTFVASCDELTYSNKSVTNSLQKLNDVSANANQTYRVKFSISDQLTGVSDYYVTILTTSSALCLKKGGEGAAFFMEPQKEGELEIEGGLRFSGRLNLSGAVNTGRHDSYGSSLPTTGEIGDVFFLLT